jgi:hypothetical protein
VVSEQEARDWLENTYRQAWEGKNTDALVQLGEIAPQDAARLKLILDGYKDFRVSFKDIDVRNDGNRVMIRFTRVDTIDGKALSHPPKELTLERTAGGRIATLRR